MTTLTPVFDRTADKCLCKDPELDSRRDPVAEGLDYWDACLIAFGTTPAHDADPIVWKAWCRREVGRLFGDLRRRLGLEATP